MILAYVPNTRSNMYFLSARSTRKQKKRGEKFKGSLAEVEWPGYL